MKKWRPDTGDRIKIQDARKRLRISDCELKKTEIRGQRSEIRKDRKA
jgi:hypothetical protein